jgi:hypothetical protein
LQQIAAGEFCAASLLCRSGQAGKAIFPRAKKYLHPKNTKNQHIRPTKKPKRQTQSSHAKNSKYKKIPAPDAHHVNLSSLKISNMG